MKKLLLSICAVLALGEFCQGAFASNTEINSKTPELLAQNNGYRYLKSVTAYFINISGNWEKSTMNFGLYSDAYGNFVIGYSNRYGTSCYNIVSSNNRDFRYAFYCSGWFYFN